MPCSQMEVRPGERWTQRIDGEEVAYGADPRNIMSFPSGISLKSQLSQKGLSYSEEFVGVILNDIAQNDRLFYTESTSTDEIILQIGHQLVSAATACEAAANALSDVTGTIVPVQTAHIPETSPE